MPRNAMPFVSAPTQHALATFTLLASLLASLPAAAAAIPERTTTLAEQQHIALTIYNQDLALIKDSRNVTLEAGENALAWRDVSARIRPETALLRNAPTAGSGTAGFTLLEQNFDFDLLTPQKLLEKSVGRNLRIIKTNPATGAESLEEARLLSANGGTVLQFSDRIESHPAGRIAFQTLPGNLRDRPTLVIRLDAARSGTQALELSYLSGGLSWKADYVAELSGREDQLDLNGWVTLTNQSGASYPDARLQLVAGNVNRVRDEIAPRAEVMMAMAAPAAAGRMKEESLFEYHLYTLERPTTLAENQTKQVALLSASQVSVRKEYRLQGADYYYRDAFGEIGRAVKPNVFVEFDNKGRNLGIPLPKGTLRLYKRDKAGNAQFIGEDRIDHTAKNETVRVRLGEAFDVSSDRKQISFKRIAGNNRNGDNIAIVETGFDVQIRNAKDEAVTVKVVEPMPGDWEMLSETLPHTKESAHTATWNVKVPAEGKTTLSYRVRVRY